MATCVATGSVSVTVSVLEPGHLAMGVVPVSIVLMLACAELAFAGGCGHGGLHGGSPARQAGYAE